MDLVDVRILKAMGTRYFGPTTSDREDYSPAALARRVELDPTTVRARLRRMQDSGFLQGFDLYPNLRLLGLQQGVTYHYGLDPDAKAEAFERLATAPGLIAAHDFHRGPFCAHFTFRDLDDRARRVGEMSALAGAPGELVSEAAPPDVPAPLGRLDWRLMVVLRRDALLPATEAAERLGVSVKTVRRRLAHLTRAHAYYVFPRLDPTKGGGLVFAGAVVHPRETERRAALARVRDVLGPHAVYDADAGRGPYYAVVALPSAGDVDALHRALARTQGVERSAANLLQAVMDYSGWLDEAVRERAEAAPRAREAP